MQYNYLGETLQDSYLGFLAKVGGEFEAGDVASVIAHYDDRMDGVKLDASQLALLFGHHGRLADGLIFVDVEVKNMNLKKQKKNPVKMYSKLFFKFC